MFQASTLTNNTLIKRILLISVLLAGVLAVFFFFYWINDSGVQIKKAKKLFAEYKTSKALELLSQTRKKWGKKDIELNFLILYAYAKSKQFDKVDQELDNLAKVPKAYKNEYLELVQVLSIYDQADLIIKLINKSKDLQLDQDFFIKLSQQRNAIDQELKILENGLNYLNSNPASKKTKVALTESETSSSIENYLLRRYLEIANIYMGNKQYQQALGYLQKAKALKITQTSPFRDEVSLNLGIAYKYLGDFSQAWDNIYQSAEQGNLRAKTMLRELSGNYVSPFTDKEAPDEEDTVGDD